MIQTDKALMFRVFMETPFQNTKPRRAANRSDFGDDATRFFEVRRMPFDFEKSNIDTDFGKYLGFITSIGWVVSIKDTVGNPTGVEIYATLEELKQNWELD